MGKLSVLFLVAFVDMVGITMIMPLLPFYATSMGAGASLLGLIIAAFSLAQLLCAPAWGRFSDLHGRKKAILLGLGITSVGYLLFAAADSILVLLLARLVQGLGGGTIGVVQAYVADSTNSSDRTRYMGWLSAATSLGAVAGPALGSLSVALGGARAPGLYAAAGVTIIALAAARFLREPRRRRVSLEQASTTETRVLGQVVATMTDRSNPAARLIWIYSIAIGAFYGTIPIFPLLMSERLSVGADTVGYMIMYLGGMGVLVRTLILGRVVDRIGEARITRLGIAVLGTGLATAGLIDSYLTLAISLTLMPLGTAFLFPALASRLSQEVRGRDRGLFMGIQHLFGGTSRVAFPLVTGILMDFAGMGLPFLLAGLLVFTTLFLVVDKPAVAASGAYPAADAS